VTRIFRGMIERGAIAKEALSHALSIPWLPGGVSGGSMSAALPSGLVLERLEFGLVDPFLVGLGAADNAGVEQLLDRAVHGAHAE